MICSFPLLYITYQNPLPPKDLINYVAVQNRAITEYISLKAKKISIRGKKLRISFWQQIFNKLMNGEMQKKDKKRSTSFFFSNHSRKFFFSLSLFLHLPSVSDFWRRKSCERSLSAFSHETKKKTDSADFDGI
jgi:hypothetical protein